ncbi:hypothetical protein BaRGS_00020673 [Batillaria attramentaria]|uniref:Apple domain-containing protein n=1 Tax=Batillaria attramentaria TaxID=370345 RepID=A0ABD0KMG1_9CAEN
MFEMKFARYVGTLPSNVRLLAVRRLWKRRLTLSSARTPHWACAAVCAPRPRCSVYVADLDRDVCRFYELVDAPDASAPDEDCDVKSCFAKACAMGMMNSPPN